MDTLICILILVFPVALGLIPAIIAKNKGYSFVLWWIYGFLIFIVAIIHVLLISDRNQPQMNNQGKYYR